jgi:hypothetical protein
MSRDIETLLRGVAPGGRPSSELATPSELRRRGDRRRVGRRVGALVSALVVVAGAAVGVSTLTSTPAPPVQPAGWTLVQACDYWQSAAAPTVTAWHAMRAARNSQLTGGTSWTTVRDATAPYGSTTRTFVGKLLAPPHPWPTPLDTAVPPVVAFGRLTVAWAEGVSATTTESGFTARWADDPSARELPADLTASQSVVDQACHVTA